MGDDAIKTKGDHTDFGFKINQPFYLVSKLPMQRVIEAIGANNVVIKTYAKNRLA